ncbi:hypothetical protein [Candidatus Nitrosotenuis cloacae]|uniref:hypothetical protein n=1 Tax=Candidatus Nitrosotenuis cloacae TaxID=1603555 RepID=UPI0022829F4F|nr:hypothetical protein [Candidatus Nitrosotenuis cloacae]
MNTKLALFGIMLLAVGLMTSVYAHKAEIVGNYKIEVGWKNEPPVVNKANSIEISIMKVTASDKHGGEHTGHHDDNTKQKSSIKHTSATTEKKTQDSKPSTKSATTKSGVSGLAKSIDADITLNGKKTFLKLSEDPKNKGVYYGKYTPKSEGHPTVHISGKINGNLVEMTFHPEKVIKK